MPCYLFTFHAYRSWMPDRPQGYVRRHQGILPRELDMAALYKRNAKHSEVSFAEVHQLKAIDVLNDGVTYINCRMHFVATDATHIHALISWQHEKSWHATRTSLKRALTISFKNQFGDRPWLVDGASRKQVRNREHFEYLVTSYLPSHRGWKWCERRGLFLQWDGDRAAAIPARRSSPASGRGAGGE